MKIIKGSMAVALLLSVTHEVNAININNMMGADPAPAQAAPAAKKEDPAAEAAPATEAATAAKAEKAVPAAKSETEQEANLPSKKKVK